MNSDDRTKEGGGATGRSGGTEQSEIHSIPSSLISRVRPRRAARVGFQQFLREIDFNVMKVVKWGVSKNLEDVS
jgi:hypothetical protein